jgi:hypothetical protein
MQRNSAADDTEEEETTGRKINYTNLTNFCSWGSRGYLLFCP